MRLLREKFLDEIFKLCFLDKSVMELCISNIEFHYFPIEEYKLIWQKLRNYYTNKGVLPTIGLISQSFNNNSDIDDHIQTILSNIKTMPIPDKEDTIVMLSEFVKDAMSMEFFEKFTTAYERGNKDDARIYMKDYGSKISEFSLTKGTNYYEKVFEGFENRHDERYYNKNIIGENYNIVPFSIDGIDEIVGGVAKGETFCFLKRSGAGGSKLLKHIGVGAARRGKKVLHIDAEGGKKKCMQYYDSTWSACLMNEIKNANIPDMKLKKLLNTSKGVNAMGGEILVHSFESFDIATMKDVRNVVGDIINTIGCIDLILIDYLELFDPSDGRKYSPDQERFRRLAVANKLSNLAIEFQSRCGTVTQANDIPPNMLKDPTFTMTRHNVSECKGLANPFSFFFSLNQTPDEYDKNIMRIYADKLRDYKANKTITIWQNYKHNRFYDRRKTLENKGLKEDNKSDFNDQDK